MVEQKKHDLCNKYAKFESWDTPDMFLNLCPASCAGITSTIILFDFSEMVS